jgi:predicted regulator of Ras-like GTPase activity (Roadblock/LC7/MglB family)
MDAAGALADLTDVSTQVRDAVVLEREGAVLASTLPDGARSGELADAARAALEAASRVPAPTASQVTALEAAVPEGSLFVAAGAGHVVAATTGPEEPAGLVLYDLRTCLRVLGEDV